MQNFVKLIMSLLIRPFREDFTYLLIISLLVCGPFAICTPLFWTNVTLKFVIWESLHAYLLCYLVVLLVSILPPILRSIGKLFFICLAFIDFIIELTCFATSRTNFSEEIVAIVMGTNMNESSEFLKTYFSYNVILVILATIVILYSLYMSSTYIAKLAKKTSVLACFATLIFFCVICAKGTESWKNKYFMKINTILSYQQPPDLKQYVKPFSCEMFKANSPQYLILILGESFSKFHSSLYGYEKTTNYYLSNLKRDSLLFVFENAIAPASNTIPCVKSIMSTYIQEYGDTINWYECTNLPQVMSKAGYKTYWISNQSPSGVVDNIASRYSELCDTTIWVGSKVKGVNKSDHDGAVLDLLQSSNIFNDSSKHFIVFHLMGSHNRFEDRYPEDFKRFSSIDYPNYKQHQRQVLADYDNSILYNDYVVNKILTYFGTNETIAFYFPDHGLDMFYTSEDYFGHGNPNIRESELKSLQIPCFLYLSRTYQNTYPIESKYLISKTQKDIHTEHIIYVLSELCGIKLL